MSAVDGGREAASNSPDPRRALLLDAAAQLLAHEGSAGLSARRVAAQAGVSTMAVYSVFGSMSALVGAVVEEGFARLEARLSVIEATPDPVADVARQTRAYLEHAREHPALYAVMFGTVDVGRHRPRTPDNLATGRETLDLVGATLERAATAGRFAEGSFAVRSFRWWTIVHGYALLETAGFVAPDRGPTTILAPLLIDFFVGEGDDRAAATASVERGSP